MVLSSSQLATLLTPTLTSGGAVNVTGVAAAASVVTVTAASHGLAVGDFVLHTSIGGAVEANGIQQVATVPTSGTYTLVGLTTVTAYTSGGTAKKITIGARAKDMRPTDLANMIETIERKVVNHGTPSSYSSELTIGTILGY